MFDNEANGPDNDTSKDTVDDQSSGESAPARNTARRTVPPPAMAFMAPPDPHPVVPQEVADARETDLADGGRPDGDSAPVKASRAGKAIASSADGSAETKPAKATRATTTTTKATKATKAAQVAKAAGKTARTGRTAKQAPVAEAASVDGPSDDSAAVSLFEAIPSDEAVDSWESPVDGGSETDEVDVDGGNRRRRGRRGRGRGKTGEDSEGDGSDGPSMGAGSGEAEEDSAGEPGFDEEDGEGGSSTRRRRRRRRRSDDEDSTTGGGRVEAGGRGEGGRADTGGGNEEVRGISGSTRLEAKRQRRRDGRETGRRRVPILSEAEFLTRREAVNRAMVIRQSGERTQIAVLEDDIVVEHYITQASSSSFAGNVYLGKVQNVLPSMEAAFVDIGKGRNAVLYAGEVNWDAAGLEGKSRNIETAMKSGDSIVVQVTKDPMGHKGARLTSQVSLPGRYLVYVPNGSMTGISRKLPDVERSRLKAILKKIVPEDAGVIIRTAAEGASEEELTRDVNRLTAQWEVIQKKAGSSSTSSPSLLYQEPDLAIRVIRDVFNEDFTRMIVFGDEAWDTVEAYVAHVAPDLADRVSRHTGESDVFADLRVDEQLAKALDRKVWLPSGGSLVIDRTEAMTVVDVNTGKYTGSGGNLEQTVTRNNLEAAEEIVRQLRLRDIGGIIVIDFIDMVLESNRDLVLRRLTECLGRDRTRHQVAEVTSLGLVQMTRKRVGQGLLEVYSEPCEHCNGRGIIVHADPVDEKRRRSSGESSRGDHHGDNRPHDGGDRNDHRGSDRGENRSDRGENRSDRGGGRSRGRNNSRTESGRTEPTADISEAQAKPATEADRDEAPGQSAPDSTPGPSNSQPAVPMSHAVIPMPDSSESADVQAWTEQEASTAGAILTASPRRRGRRGASRPAGPPVADG